jgi:hypothetical protein
MNVKELKLALAGLPDDMEIILQKDGEGNDYSPLAETDTNAIYIPNTSWYHLNPKFWPTPRMHPSQHHKIKSRPHSCPFTPPPFQSLMSLSFINCPKFLKNFACKLSGSGLSPNPSRKL